MKVWELMAELAKAPAGSDVCVAIETLEGPEGRPFCVIADNCTTEMNGPHFQIYVTAETLRHKEDLSNA